MDATTSAVSSTDSPRTIQSYLRLVFVALLALRFDASERVTRRRLVGLATGLAGVIAKPGDVVQVGHTIAWLVAPGEAPPAATAPDWRGSSNWTAARTPPAGR